MRLVRQLLGGGLLLEGRVTGHCRVRSRRWDRRGRRHHLDLRGRRRFRRSLCGEVGNPGVALFDGFCLRGGLLHALGGGGLALLRLGLAGWGRTRFIGGDGALGRTRDGRDGLAVARLAEVLGEHLPHVGIARLGGAPAHHHAHEPLLAPPDGGDEIEARGVDVAGLDAVGALVAAEEAVVAGDGAALVDEAPRAEIGIVLREVAHQAEAQRGHVARCRHLAGIGQARGIGECGARHAHVARRAGHAPGEVLLGARDVLGHCGGHVIGGLHDECADGGLDGDRPAGLHPELGGGHAGRPGRHADRRIEAQPAGLQFLEEYVERHHLGE